MNTEVPLIDWADHNTLTEEFKSAFTTVGFARIYNLWTQQELLAIKEWFTVVENWFLTEQNKQKYQSTADVAEGWTPLESQVVNPTRKRDWKENFEIDRFTDLSYLPDELSKSLAITHPLFFSKGKDILKIFELMLETEPGLLTDAHADPNSHHLRTAYYPASEKRDNQLPCGEHKDYNTITLLFSPDKGKRLQVKNRAGEWKDIKYLDNSVVINIGNLMQIWTQDYLISSPHRVLFNSEDSFTTAYFMNLPEEHNLKPIGPNPRKYPNTLVKRFNSQFHKAKQMYDLRQRIRNKK